MDRNGTVFGVVMDDNLEAKYSKARNSHERDLMRGSKYMQELVTLKVNAAVKPYVKHINNKKDWML